jgi:uncharacterized UBP type Zn finger protein
MGTRMSRRLEGISNTYQISSSVFDLRMKDTKTASRARITRMALICVIGFLIGAFLLIRTHRGSCAVSPVPEEKPIERGSIRINNAEALSESISAEEASTDGSSGTDWVGIKNGGNTCYQNALLQCIMRSPIFPEGAAGETPLALGLQRLYGALLEGDGPADASGVRMQMQPREVWNGRRQQDAHEFLVALRDQHPPIAEATTIITNQHVMCSECADISTKTGTLEDIQLCLPSTRTDLQYLIDLHFQPESVTRECESCDKAMRWSDVADKWIEIITPPKILVIQLKRFVTDPETLKNSKLNTMIDCPLKDFKLPGVTETFDLIGTVQHGGSSTGGHYLAHVFDSEKKVWVKLNDRSATVMSEERVVTQQTTLLFYALKA